MREPAPHPSDTVQAMTIRSDDRGHERTAPGENATPPSSDRLCMRAPSDSRVCTGPGIGCGGSCERLAQVSPDTGPVAAEPAVDA